MGNNDNDNAKSNDSSKRRRSGTEEDDEDLRQRSKSPAIAGNSISGAGKPTRADSAIRVNTPSDDDITTNPRKYAVEIRGDWKTSLSTKQQLAEFVDAHAPDTAQVREIIQTSDNRILIFPHGAKDYNLLVNSTRWKAGAGISATPAPKGKTNSAVIIHNVDQDVTPDKIIGALVKCGFAPIKATRMKRAKDGAETPNVKVEMDVEADIVRITKEGFYMFKQRHGVSKYNAPLERQCFKCQRTDHLSIKCKYERRCLKCGGNHHHKECLVLQAGYVCCNCGGNHVANDASCPIIQKARKEATDAQAAKATSATVIIPSAQQQQISNATSNAWQLVGQPSSFAAAASASTTQHLQLNNNGGNTAQSTLTTTTAPNTATISSSQPQHPPQPLLLQGPTANSAVASKDDIHAIVKDAVSEAVAASTNQLLEGIAATFAAQFAKSVDDAMQRIMVTMERYARYNYESSLDEDEEEDEETIIRNSITSTPSNPGRAHDIEHQTDPEGTPSHSKAHQQAALTAPTFLVGPEEYTVFIPPTSFKIKKGKKEKEIAKIITDEGNARAKILKKDLKKVQIEILNASQPLSPPSTLPQPSTPHPETRKQTSPSPKRTRGRPKKKRGMSVPPKKDIAEILSASQPLVSLAPPSAPSSDTNSENPTHQRRPPILPPAILRQMSQQPPSGQNGKK